MEGREREIAWEGEKERLRGREKRGQEGGKERGRKRNEKYIIQFHICSVYFKILRL